MIYHGKKQYSPLHQDYDKPQCIGVFVAKTEFHGTTRERRVNPEEDTSVPPPVGETRTGRAELNVPAVGFAKESFR